MVVTKDLVVSIDYTLTDQNRQVLDSTDGSPLEYLHGHENIIPGLEKALEGKSEGASFDVCILARDAYGERNEDLIIPISRDNFDAGAEIETGMFFEAESPDGSQQVRVIKVDENEITVDANHPLAGMDLNFSVTVAAIREAAPEEIQNGLPNREEESCACCGGECDCGEDGECSCGEDGACSCGGGENCSCGKTG